MSRWTRWFAAWVAALGMGVAHAAAPFAAHLTLDGPIGPAAAEYVHDAMARASTDGARVVVLQMDTPGGLSESMRGIVADILASPVPVIGYVAPGGARAASAGTYILYACQLAAMAPATHLGAATPVSLGGSTPMPSPLKNAPAKPAASAPADEGDAESHKVLNDAIAYIRSLAQLRGRNADWAEAAVRGAETLTADEAVRRNVVNFVAPDVAAVLAQADGRMVQVGEQPRKLLIRGLPVRDYAPGWRTRLLSVITNPTIAYALLLAGIYGLVLEAFHPGAMLPGLVGGISLLVGAYALQLLPVNYAGLALMALGVALIIGEVLTPTLGVLGIGGLVSFVIGSVMLMNTHVPGYGINLGVIAGLATGGALVLGLILWLVMRGRRGRAVVGESAMIGLHGELLEPLAEGGTSWARVRGERWRVKSGQAITAGTRVTVIGHTGLLLSVQPCKED